MAWLRSVPACFPLFFDDCLAPIEPWRWLYIIKKYLSILLFQPLSNHKPSLFYFALYSTSNWCISKCWSLVGYLTTDLPANTLLLKTKAYCSKTVTFIPLLRFVLWWNKLNSILNGMGVCCIFAYNFTPPPPQMWIFYRIMEIFSPPCPYLWSLNFYQNSVDSRNFR